MIQAHLRAGTLQQVFTKSTGLWEKYIVGKPCSAGGGTSNNDHVTVMMNDIGLVSPEMLREYLIPIRGQTSQRFLGVKSNTEEEGGGELDCGEAYILAI